MYQIMIVEDETWIRNAMVKMIEDEISSEYEIVAEAEDGEEALNLIYDVWPTVIITDIKMPNKDGLWLVKEIYERQLPVVPIIVSGYDDFQYAQKAIRYGVSDYLLKPVITDDLLPAIKNTFKRLMTNQNMHRYLVEIYEFNLLCNDNNCSNIFKKINNFIDVIWNDYNITTGERIVILKILSGKINSIIIENNREFVPIKCDEFTYDNTKLHFNQLQELWTHYLGNVFNSDSNRTIEDICEYIKLNYMGDITLSDISKRYHYSVSHFCLLFKSHTGYSFTQYLNQYRMKKACELLSDFKYKVYEISELVGFQTLPYFNRVFKQSFGCSPNEYRRGVNRD